MPKDIKEEVVEGGKMWGTLEIPCSMQRERERGSLAAAG